MDSGRHRARASSSTAALAALLFVFVAAGCATAPPSGAPGEPAAPEAPESLGPLPALHSTLWTQTSAGYRAAALQTYRLAGQSLKRALRDPTWSALVDTEETDGPPAIILDVDETVLDNSAYNARRLRVGEGYTSESWARWVEEAAAPPVPGALAFVLGADDVGVSIYYVTNRDAELEEATLRNLLATGFPVDSAGERLMMRGERPGWGSDKRSRRLAVAADHRVVLLIGDDLNDLASGVRTSPQAYREALDRYDERFGKDWFMLPNPTYGSWEQAGYGFRSDLGPEARIRTQLEALETLQERP